MSELKPKPKVYHEQQKPVNNAQLSFLDVFLRVVACQIGFRLYFPYG